jgi:hypothetical protein
MLFRMLSLHAELGYTLSKHFSIKLAPSFQYREPSPLHVPDL